jgi:hypothetical protein
MVPNIFKVDHVYVHDYVHVNVNVNSRPLDLVAVIMYVHVVGFSMFYDC